MPWLYILLAGLCEMSWPVGFKYTNGFRAHPSVIVVTFAIMVLSFWLMSRAIAAGMPMGTAYAIWTGVGAAGTAAFGMYFFNEPRDFARLVCIGLIIAGAVGLKLFAAEPSTAAGPAPVAEAQ